MKKDKENGLTDDQIRLLWWLHEAEQLEEKLTKEDVDQINRYVREHGGNDMWEIDYDD